MSKQQYSRRKFIHQLSGTTALITGSAVLSPASSQQDIVSAGEVKISFAGTDGIELPGSVEIENRAFRLKVETRNGLNPNLLFDKKNNVTLANGDYYYGFGRPQKVEVEILDLPDAAREVSFTGVTDNLKVVHSFVFPQNEEWVEEYIMLENIGDKSLNLNESPVNLRHGFNSVINNTENKNALSQNWRFLAVPFLINTSSGTRQEYVIKDFIAAKPHQMASEGWIMMNANGGILIIKYSQAQMEYAIVSNHLPGSDATNTSAKSNLLWGGSGMNNNNPESAMHFSPNQTLKFGLNRYIPFTGNKMKGFTLFRNFMDSKGHHFPKDFNPPVHWNEIYDNPHWWNAPDTPEKRAQYYQFKDMEIEAVKAAELGCEALYLDPGWDTVMGSTIWGDDRLRSCKEFCDIMWKKYHLKVSLHTPLAVWNQESAYPESARKPFAVNNNYLCSGAPAWWQTKLERLLKLASDGICFFMFDGTNYTGACEVKEHYHPTPYSREDHIRSYARLAEEIHKKFPKVLIEMHDQVLGPQSGRYVPMYYTHHAASFDEIWAFEYMWDPMSDLTSGRFKSLYYYNLAYNIPLYDHINLKTDNTNALVFWWTASTCRHLGIGGKNGVKSSPPNVEVELAHIGIGEKNGPPPEIWEAHKKAMKTYMRLKPFYVRGIFYGIDELTHVHTLPENNSCVINFFNLEKTDTVKHITCSLSDLGLKSTIGKIKGAKKWRFEKKVLYLEVEIRGMGVTVLELN